MPLAAIFERKPDQGTDVLVRREIVLAAADRIGYTAHRVLLSTVTLDRNLAGNSTELRILARRWEKTARLTQSVLLVECQGVDLTENTPLSILSILLEEIETLLRFIEARLRVGVRRYRVSRIRNYNLNNFRLLFARTNDTI